MTQSKLTSWLVGLPNVANVVEVTLRIGKETYQGARYHDMRKTDDGTPYTLEMVYLLGDLPSCYRRSSRTVFTNVQPCDSREWYVVGWHDGGQRIWDAYTTPKPPFGVYFMLSPWSLPSGEKIDEMEVRGGKKPYRRVRVERDPDKLEPRGVAP